MHDDHDEGADHEHYVELHLDYSAGEPDEDGAHPLTIGTMKVHLHHVPNGLYVDTLLILARMVVAKGMEENSFKDNVPPQVRHEAARMMASRYLIDRLNSPDLIGVEPVDATVPDDASSLFEEYGG